MDGEFYVDYTKTGNSWSWVPENKVRERIGQSNKVKREFTSGGDAVDWMKYVDDEFSWHIQPEIRRIETESAVYKFIPKSDNIRDKSRALGRSTRLTLSDESVTMLEMWERLLTETEQKLIENMRMVYNTGAKKYNADSDS